MIGAVVLYVLLVVVIFLLQKHMVYHPARELAGTPDQAGLAYQDVYIRTSDGVKINAWFVPADDAKGTILFFHGNAGNISHRVDSLAILHDLGYSALIIDYRGYGRSEGSPGEEGTYLDAQAAWDYLRQKRKIDAAGIVVLGRSMGAAVAAWLAGKERPGGVILESGFTSVPDRGAELFPFLPVRWMSLIRYDTLGRIASVRCPVLFVHSRDDRLIPISHGRRLFEAANEPKRLLEITGTHNDGFIISGAVYTDGLVKFLDSVLPGR